MFALLALFSLVAVIAHGQQVTLDMSSQCGSNRTFAENSVSSIKVVSHSGYGKTRYPVGLRCRSRINMGTCTRARLNCNNFQVPSWRCGRVMDFLTIGSRPYCTGRRAPGANQTFTTNIDLTFVTNWTWIWWLCRTGFGCTFQCDAWSTPTPASTGAPSPSTSPSPSPSTSPSPSPSTSPSPSPSTSPSPSPSTNGRCACGQNGSRSSRIVGGIPANRGDVPWQVALTRSASATVFVFCGGSLINANHVFTAAHCTSGKSPSRIVNIIGMVYRTNPGEGVAIATQSIFIHPDYDSRSLNNDFSIIRMSSSVDFTDTRLNHISPICWPSLAHTSDERALISGWGTVRLGGGHPNQLLKATVDIIADNVCNSGEAYGGDVLATMVCAGIYPNGGIDTCQGDSGGPLAVQRNGLYELVGATSWGSGCASARKPGVYSDIHVVLESWVRAIAGAECPRV